MIHALGYSQSEFDAADPGRLCRGRERWIEPFDIQGPVPLHRVVITGAQFSDDSARDALRGVAWSKVPVPELLDALFPGAELLAFMEDGHPADIPHAATEVEVYSGHRAGGRVEEPMVRWLLRLRGLDALTELLGPAAAGDPARGLLVLPDAGELPDALAERLFLLTGFSTLDSPPAHYQPAALGEVLEFGAAVILFHRDKHGIALGIYSREPLSIEGPLGSVAESHGALVVPFAIPPMLARWDRALSELRQHWMATRDEDFPVPPCEEPTYWTHRRRSRRTSSSEGDEE
ncbi:MAG: hypothetical protein EA397_00620 [Deltaproteobacteria bacterium]|nr:MAG: hypothetical protein EA397_00620 [Deltaproteobacteria bacterium]